MEIIGPVLSLGISVFLNRNPQQTNVGELVHKGFGSVRDYHKCLSILLQPLVKAQMDPPLLDVRLEDQIKRVRALLVMGAVLGDEKAMTCCVAGSSSRTMRLLSYVYPLSCCLRHHSFFTG
jgi:hypothetical protein